MRNWAARYGYSRVVYRQAFVAPSCADASPLARKCIAHFEVWRERWKEKETSGPCAAYRRKFAASDSLPYLPTPRRVS